MRLFIRSVGVALMVTCAYVATLECCVFVYSGDFVRASYAALAGMGALYLLTKKV